MPSPLVAAGDTKEHQPATLENAAFFSGVLDFVAYRDASRIDRTADDPQALSALQEAIISVNRELGAWVLEKTEAGYASIEEIPAPLHMPAAYFAASYCRAVYHYADALLTEKYRDFDSTGEGHQRSDAMSEKITAYRRDSICAVADILEGPRRRCELL